MTQPFQNFVAQRAKRWLNYTAVEPSTTGAATSPALRAVVTAAMQQHHCDHYARRPGIVELCARVVERLAAKDLVVDPQEGVIITGGPTETRYVTLCALATGKTVYILPSLLARYQAIADLVGATLVPVDPTAPLPTPGTGFLLVSSVDELTPALAGQLAAWATANELPVIADEVDSPLLALDHPARPFAGLPGMAERTLTLGGFPDTPGLDAWQVAWFAGPKSLAGPVAKLKQAMTICSPAAGQYAALAATEEVL
jgi:N-succinyldiaminopimelate aminotransferase